MILGSEVLIHSTTSTSYLGKSMTSSSPSSSSRPNKRAASIRDFLPPPSAKQYIMQPSRRMSLRPIPSPASSSSSSSSSSCCFSAISASSNGTPPSDHAGESSMQDKTDVDKATREYHGELIYNTLHVNMLLMVWV